MIFRFTPEADAELTEARQWYSHHRKDLDLEFMQCIEAALSRIRSNSRLSPVVYRGMRRAVVRRFPFAICMKLQAGRFRSFLSFIRDAIRMCGSRE